MAMLKSCLVTYFQSFCFLLKVHKQYISATNLVGAGVAELLLVLPPTPKVESVCFLPDLQLTQICSHDKPNHIIFNHKIESNEDRATTI